jgi:hypothetical protein
VSFLWTRLREAHDLNLRVTGWVLTREEIEEIGTAFGLHQRDLMTLWTQRLGLPIRRVINSRG